ncbi:MAG TPA: hypothetical protein VG323_06005 [Thermoanaerobaculia bacterium]|nr:hypothetical protein [Thermoanaerobaculia bacterium]
MDPALYVRVEGVNLVNFVEDVHDLSTIRGGSFLLLDAVDRVRERFALQPISTGASSGFFAAPDGDSARLRGDIEAFLHDDPQLRHATFVVDVFRDEFLAARESLAAMNRWRQFQQPTVAVPSHPPRPAHEECALDHVRPAADSFHDAENRKKPVSASVKVRRDFGRQQKKAFYARELKKLGDAALAARVATSDFVLDLETLAAEEDCVSLDNKIAVIHFDGNKFGSIQRNCRTREELESFDRTIKTYRRTALARLLQQISDRPKQWWTPDGQIRLETLLWGGDELTWVVPAWKGWEVVALFYDVSSSWTFGKTPLTHAGGVVFCHRAAPIHRMTKIAKKLAESTKGDTAPGSHAEGDRFAYQVLESFDEIGPDFEAFRSARLPGGITGDLILRAAGLGAVAAHADVVRRQFPRSKLHDIVIAIRDRRDPKPLIDSVVADLPRDAGDALQQLFQYFGGERPASWLHLAELWDYAIEG